MLNARYERMNHHSKQQSMNALRRNEFAKFVSATLAYEDSKFTTRQDQDELDAESGAQELADISIPSPSEGEEYLIAHERLSLIGDCVDFILDHILSQIANDFDNGTFPSYPEANINNLIKEFLGRKKVAGGITIFTEEEKNKIIADVVEQSRKRDIAECTGGGDDLLGCTLHFMRA